MKSRAALQELDRLRMARRKTELDLAQEQSRYVELAGRRKRLQLEKENAEHALCNLLQARSRSPIHEMVSESGGTFASLHHDAICKVREEARIKSEVRHVHTELKSVAEQCARSLEKIRGLGSVQKRIALQLGRKEAAIREALESIEGEEVCRPGNNLRSMAWDGQLL